MIKFFYSFIISSILILFVAQATFAINKPHFISGHHQTWSICQDFDPLPINTLLAISDTNVGLTGSWSLITTPVHGSVSVSTFTATTTGGIITPTGITYAPAISFSGLDSIKFVINDGVGTDTTIVVVTILPLPHVGPIIGSLNMCIGAHQTLIDTAAGGVWSSSPGTGSATINSSGVVTALTVGIDTIKYTSSNTCGLINTLVEIAIHPAPTVAPITGAVVVCIGATASLTDATPGGTWSGLYPSLATVLVGAIHGISAGVDTVKYTVSNSYCSTVVSRPVTVQPIPTVHPITGLSVICQGAFSTVTDSSIGGTWTVQNTNASVGYLSSFTALVSAISTGTDTIVYNNSNSCGSAIAKLGITINPLPAIHPITGITEICTGNNATFLDSSSGGTWTVNNAALFITSSGVAFAYTQGLDTINYAISNSCGTTTTSFIVNVLTIPNTGIITGVESLCQGLTATFSDTVLGGIWGSTKGLVSIDSGIATGIAAGTDTIYYALSNVCGQDTAFLSLPIIPLPNPGIILGEPLICPSDTVYFTETLPAGTGIWMNGDTALAYAYTSITSDTFVIAAHAPGIDTIKYQVTNTCGTDTFKFPLQIGNHSICNNAIKPVSKIEKGLDFYPNPNNGEIGLKVNGSTGLPHHIIITSMLGQSLMELDVEEGKQKNINVNLPTGNYWVYDQSLNSKSVLNMVIIK